MHGNEKQHEDPFTVASVGERLRGGTTGGALMWLGKMADYVPCRTYERRWLVNIQGQRTITKYYRDMLCFVTCPDCGIEVARHSPVILKPCSVDRCKHQAELVDLDPASGPREELLQGRAAPGWGERGFHSLPVITKEFHLEVSSIFKLRRYDFASNLRCLVLGIANWTRLLFDSREAVSCVGSLRLLSRSAYRSHVGANT